MKFAKTYSETLESPDIRDEWRRAAIEYRRLKKLITNVEKELSDYGLNSDVLRQIMENKNDSNGTVKVRYELGGTKDRPEPRLVVSGLQKPLAASRDLATVSELSEYDEQDPTAYEDFVSSLGDRLLDKLYHATSDSHTTESEDFTESDEEGEMFVYSRNSSTETLRMREEQRVSGEATENGTGVAGNGGVVLGGGGNGPGGESNMNAGKSNGSGGESNASDGPENINNTHIGVDLTETPLSLTHATTAPALSPPSLDLASLHLTSRPPRGTSSTSPVSTREDGDIVISLSADSRFMSLLAQAVNSLAEMQTKHRSQFTTRVEKLSLKVARLTSTHKKELYTWREVFSLWVESQIFESQRERDRGSERSVEEVDARLNAFIDRVRQHKLIKKMRAESRELLNEFIHLNVELLALRRFSEANQEAVRKILKKHDKRTALPGAVVFSSFLTQVTQQLVPQQTEQGEGAILNINPVLQQELRKRRAILPEMSPSPPLVASSDATSTALTTPSFSSNLMTIANYSTLRHSLLTTMTSILLPIVPQLEDYECGICGDVAYRPIKLDCGHRFCVKCLIKMQQRALNACPHCRAPVVLRAGADNLDLDTEHFLEEYFPYEVRDKKKADNNWKAKEDLEAMGLHEHKCVVQ